MRSSTFILLLDFSTDDTIRYKPKQPIIVEKQKVGVRRGI